VISCAVGMLAVVLYVRYGTVRYGRIRYGMVLYGTDGGTSFEGNVP
jgi:hypothetical protein